LGGGERRWEDSGGFLYHKIILFASKKPHSCRNTWKNVRFRFLLFQLNLWIALQVVRNIALRFFHAID
ncbi:hypothetical protein, partial [Leptospira borgpetersenii]|uniref:hypothetical protein n=1 Tax=Leptospira borgpetersenii TaxID=174 RepID=UPI001F23A2C3